MVLLQLLFVGTKLGLALRAVAINPQSAAFSGLPVGRLLMVGWGLAAALGAVAGALVAPAAHADPGDARLRPRLRAGRRHPRRPHEPDRRRRRGLDHRRPGEPGRGLRRRSSASTSRSPCRSSSSSSCSSSGPRACSAGKPWCASDGPSGDPGRFLAASPWVALGSVVGARVVLRSCCRCIAAGVRQPDARAHRRLRRRRARPQRGDGLHRAGLARPDLLPRRSAPTSPPTA